MARSASDDDGVVGGRFCERCQVAGITGQDPIAWAGQQDDGCVNRIAGASYAQQDTAWRPSWGLTGRRPPRGAVAPAAGGMTRARLGDDLAWLPYEMLLGDAQPGDHGTVSTVDGNKAPASRTSALTRRYRWWPCQGTLAWASSSVVSTHAGLPLVEELRQRFCP